MNVSKKEIECIIVSPSKVHGKGVFANTFISKGTMLRWQNTKELSQHELSELPASERKFTDIQDGKIFLVGEPERYINHSCDNNTIPGDLSDITSRDIVEGEEITADYSNFFVLEGAFACHCGSSKCRGVITGRVVE